MEPGETVVHAAGVPEPVNLTLMAVHAHPDDESSSTGGVLARYGDEGMTTVVVTCTNGEYGDAPGHVKPGEPGHDPVEVAKIRASELEEACKHLGVTHLEMLGYHDSGMPDWYYKDEERAFCNVPLEESVARLVPIVQRYRPDVMVTYDDMGGYNHPDHIQAARIAVEACRQTGVPSKLYLIARRRRDWEKLREQMQAAGIEVPAPPARMLEPEVVRRMEEAEMRITTTVDTSAVAARKRDALAAHASQLDRSWWVRFPEDAFVEVFGHETFIRAEDRTGVAVPEDDLFDGLR
ncbi:MAG: PIG-L family deacetylase [Nitrososphaerales archaeon]